MEDKELKKEKGLSPLMALFLLIFILFTFNLEQYVTNGSLNSGVIFILSLIPVFIINFAVIKLNDYFPKKEKYSRLKPYISTIAYILFGIISVFAIIGLFFMTIGVF